MCMRHEQHLWLPGTKPFLQERPSVFFKRHKLLRIERLLCSNVCQTALLDLILYFNYFCHGIKDRNIEVALKKTQTIKTNQNHKGSVKGGGEQGLSHSQLKQVSSSSGLQKSFILEITELYQAGSRTPVMKSN